MDKIKSLLYKFWAVVVLVIVLPVSIILETIFGKKNIIKETKRQWKVWMGYYNGY